MLDHEVHPMAALPADTEGVGTVSAPTQGIQALEATLAQSKIYMQAFGKIADLHSPTGEPGREACSCGEKFYDLCPTAWVIVSAQAEVALASARRNS